MQIDRFQKLYEYSFPNIHDFICIEDNWGKSKEYFLSTFQKEQINDTLDELSNKNPKIKIIKQGFSQKEWTWTKWNICYVPMRNIHYHISNNGLVWISPCHLDYKKITDHQIFTKQALTKGCNKCNSSCKDAINNYMSEVIKQYKLMSK